MKIHSKVKAGVGGGTAGGALAVLLCYVLPGTEPTDVVVAITTLCTVGLGFVAAYLKQEMVG